MMWFNYTLNPKLFFVLGLQFSVLCVITNICTVSPSFRKGALAGEPFIDDYISTQEQVGLNF